jgi:hypothetical protein
MSEDKSGENVKVRFTLDYRGHLVGELAEAQAADNEALIAYGEITHESEENGIRICVVEYGDSDGWEARSQAEETLATLNTDSKHASLERVK